MVQKIFWGVLIGVVVWTMLASSDVNGVKMLSNLGGLPALILELIMCVALVKVALAPSRYDVRRQDYDESGVPIKSVAKPALMSEAEIMKQYEGADASLEGERTASAGANGRVIEQ